MAHSSRPHHPSRDAYSKSSSVCCCHKCKLVSHGAKIGYRTKSHRLVICQVRVSLGKQRSDCYLTAWLQSLLNSSELLCQEIMKNLGQVCYARDSKCFYGHRLKASVMLATPRKARRLIFLCSPLLVP